MIYLDNAATTFPKPSHVLREVRRCLEHYCGNAGRSTHKLALKCAEKIYETRERVAGFLNFRYPERVVFTQNATHALNLAIKGMIREKSHVITSDIEHNSVLRPLYKQAELYGVEISFFDSDIPLRDAIVPLIREDTKFIVTSIASNVTGKSLDINQLYSIAKEYNLFTIIDASQYIGHLPIDLEATPFDILCAPGHKSLFGLQGSGFAVFRSPDGCATLMEGGSGSDTLSHEMPLTLPEMNEAGTLNTPAIVGLGAGISYLENYTQEAIEEKLGKLTERMNEILHDTNLIVYGCNNGIASFEVPRISPQKFSSLLDKYSIATRSGLHCAPLIHRKLGTEEHGTVRVSVSIINTIDDLDKLFLAIRNLTK